MGASSHASSSCLRVWGGGLVALIALLGSLTAISDGEMNVRVALEDHLPSARIFRSLLEINLALWTSAACLAIWYRIRMPVEELLFHSSWLLTSWGWASPHQHNHHHSAPRGYVTTESHDRDDEENDNDDEEREKTGEGEEDAKYGDTKDADAMEDDDDDDDDDTNEPPVPRHVPLCRAALRTTLTILVALFFFVLASREQIPWLPAPLFSLGLLVTCGVQLLQAFRKQPHLLGVALQTVWAPSCPVDFRDGLIGDVFTSLVRPLQDLSYTTFYLVFGLQGWWSSAWKHAARTTADNASSMASNSGQILWNTTANAGQDLVDQANAQLPALETSWLLHTVVLPMCLVSPLWWRYLQNLRQTFDGQTRWPTLGNAAKYFCAAQVAVWGMYHPQARHSPIWLLCFFLATIYQIWWDIVMDWGLLQYSRGSSETDRRRRWRVRPRRLYPTIWYILIGTINIILRFGWTLSFIPTKYLSRAHILETSWGSWQTVLSWTLGSAEIMRRSLWALLRMEWEILKTHESFRGGMDESDTTIDGADQDNDGLVVELAPMKQQQQQNSTVAGDLDDGVQLVTVPVGRRVTLGELVVYGLFFWLLGTITAVHRGTL